MEKKELRIIYMGTPEFAVESLRELVENGYNVVGVVTMPDKPMGKHQSVLQSSPVKKYAESKGISVLQPEKLKDEQFLSGLKDLKADLQIVVAFRMLPEVVWDMPRYGTFNLHASLLPQYRGAAPINWAIINGEKETGVTTFFLTHEIDTGLIICQKRLPIADTDDVSIVHDRLMQIGARLVRETVDLILSGDVEAVSQEQFYSDESELRPAPKIFKDICRIDWNQPLKKIYDFVRGLSPYPAAWTELAFPDGNKQALKIFKAEKLPAEHQLPVGTIVSDNKKHLDVAVRDGYLRLLSIQLAGKKRMDIADFLNGFKQMEHNIVI
ncbi:MAG: methionyl-tRNA formyltransferase [Tannerellaceae bacterium]|nr:methionyl-tRNA formyltransferase [Tannerellaceae bacterium]